MYDLMIFAARENGWESMSRLIDADAMYEEWLKNGENEFAYDTNDFLYSIDNQPIVDAVEVVRCRECAKDGLTTCPLCWIENHTLQFVNHDPDFYCGAGERKEK